MFNDAGQVMTQREPGRLPQTTMGAELLEVEGRPSWWARRMAWAAVAVLVAAVALLIVGIFPPRHAAVRRRPEVHVGDHGLPAIRPGA